MSGRCAVVAVCAISLGVRRAWRMMNAPFFFALRISRASGSKPGAMMPSHTSTFQIWYVHEECVCAWMHIKGRP